jgi:hypothetical protein
LLCDPVTRLFNKSLQEGVVPLCFKSAIIIPVPKSKGPSPEFRPISLLPHFSKILENSVIDHWLRPKILPSLKPEQYAFTGNIGGGTTNALIKVNNSVLKHLDHKSGASRLLLVDFTKAFDHAQPLIILKCLIQHNASRQCTLWISNFLFNRLQRVVVQGKLS